MPNTTRMQIPVPSFRKNPWYDAITSTFNAIDASLYTSREDRNIVLMDGGVFTWNATTGVLAWADVLALNSSIAGFYWRLPAGNVTLQDGEVLYVNLSRYPSRSQDVTALTASQVPSTDDAVMLAIRKGNRVYFKNGALLNDGDSRELFALSTGGFTKARIPLGFDSQVDGVTLSLALGAVPFDPTDYKASPAVTLEVVLSVSVGTLTGTAKLYNITDAEYVTSGVLTTSAVVPTKLSAALTVGTGAGELQLSDKIYEIQISVNGTLSTEIAFFGSAHLLVE